MYLPINSDVSENDERRATLECFIRKNCEAGENDPEAGIELSNQTDSPLISLTSTRSQRSRPPATRCMTPTRALPRLSVWSFAAYGSGWMRLEKHERLHLIMALPTTTRPARHGCARCLPLTTRTSRGSRSTLQCGIPQASRAVLQNGWLDPQVVLLVSRPLIALIGLLYAETALFLNDAAMFTHECVVSVNLAGKSQPASRDNFQRSRLSLIRR